MPTCDARGHLTQNFGRAAINIAEAGLAGQIDLLEGDITHLERFGAAEFSFVVCVGGAISHALESGPQAVRELVRVAQPSMPELLGGGTHLLCVARKI